MSSKILITGADGFIGSHLTEKLVSLGYDVRAFVMYNSFNSWGWLDDSPVEIKKNLEVFAGDIRDPHGVNQALKNCDAVIHLAALIAIPYSYHSPDTYIDTNIKGTLNILQAARNQGISHVIHTSTSEVYGSAQFVPITESHPLQGQSPYSASKIGADQLAMSFYSSFDTPITIIRPFNTYGPRQSARAVIPTIISQIAAGNSSLTLGSLDPTRDFSHVSDTVSGFIAALNTKAGIGRTINLGTGFEISIGETAKIIAQLMGIEASLTQNEERLRPSKSEVNRLCSDNTLAQNLLQWQPNKVGLAGLQDGLQDTINWFSDAHNLAKYKTDTYNI